MVVDLSRALAGPHAAMMLGDMGARVIKVESPTGDESRSWGPPFVGPEDSPVSTYFLCANRNKESIQLDLKSPSDHEALEALVQRADVLIENFRPGVMDRLGLSTGRLHELNPGLVVLSITGFGHDGPDADRPGFDQIAQGEAGLMSLTGAAAGAATKVGVPIADLLAGIHGAFGVASALVDRQHSGRGTVVRTSLLAGLVGVHAYQGTRFTVAGQVPEPSGNHHPSIAPYGAFRTADELLQIAVGNDSQWLALARVVGVDAQDARYVSNALRVAHRTELQDELEAALSREPAATWLARLRSAGVPAGRVRTLDQVYAWDQVASQGLLVEVEHPVLGRVDLPGPPLRLEDADGRSTARAAHQPPPMLGEHTQALREWLDGDVAG
ncbi:CoA-transferase [Angustibacter sp. Root456]|nr:CoA-transferase [Angustibacter sp. Root456]